jgi:hypothetical protein
MLKRLIKSMLIKYKYSFEQAQRDALKGIKLEPKKFTFDEFGADGFIITILHEWLNENPL